MRKLTLFLSMLVCLLSLTGCSRTASAQIFAMDTIITLEVMAAEPDKALSLAQEEILRLEQMLSIGDEASDIARLNAGQTTTVSPDTAQLLESALSLSAATDGAYDCTIAPVAQVWGWYTDSPAVPDERALQAAMAGVDYRAVTLDGTSVHFEKTGMGIDLGGIGKGYAAGKLNTLLREAGVTSGILSLGGNVRVIGAKPNGQPWIVGIADPADPASYLCTVAVTDCAVVTSGDYQRFFVEDQTSYHHILDPKTGYSVDNGLHAVTIVCEDDTLADGLSTALFVMGQEKAIAFWQSGVYDFEAVLVSEDGISVTQGLSDCFACQGDYEVIVR